MIKKILMGSIGFLMLGCSTNEISPVVNVEVLKGEHYIEDIVYSQKNGKKNILFKHTYFLNNDSISYSQKDYLNVGVRVYRAGGHTDTQRTKSIQLIIIKDSKVVKNSFNQILKEPISNFKIENTNSARGSFGYSLVRNGNDWQLVSGDNKLSWNEKLPEFILEEVLSKGITQVIHTRVISDFKKVTASSKVYSVK
jgi:hypothetical protein